MNYNEEQLRAIRHHEGFCLVVAGPGSGKTAVITERAATLIEQRGVEASRLLTLTFSKAAALEMLERFTKRTASAYPAAVFGTFHSVFYRILMDSAGEKALKILGALERGRLMEQVMKSLGLYPSAESVASLLRGVSNRKNCGRKGQGVSGALPYAERFEEIFERYEDLRRELELMDYDDIAPDCLRLFRERPEVLQRWRERFCFLQVDEYQDIGPVQEELLHLLAAKHRNLFAVGDDDQSIYGFRGADPKVMQRFLSLYPDAERIQLPVNYRSDEEIIEAADKVIRRNRTRLPKARMRSALSAQCRDRQVFCAKDYRDTEEELKDLCNLIKENAVKTTEGPDFSGIAVIVRTHACAAKAAEILAARGILFDMKEDVKTLYEEPVAKDILAYLRFAHEGGKRADFLRMMNKPLRYFSRNCVTREVVEQEDLLRHYRNSPQMQERVRTFFSEIRLLSVMRPKTAIGYLRRAVGYERYLREENDRAGLLYALGVLDRMEEDAEKLRTDQYFVRVRERLSFAEHYRGEHSKAAARSRGVKLMTMHASKGLEFDHVFLPMCNAGIVPHMQAAGEEALEEECRMLYVAMTRARKSLQVSFARQSARGALLPSPFLWYNE
ncbi:MAG: ATP-dependent helicase [Lachnospiraceae bacterium]|nr:ATP-dependent helicase [Lachnospiraceae bacterium]